MRELLDLATEKRLRQLLGTVARAGAAVVPVDSEDEGPDRFAVQIEDF